MLIVVTHALEEGEGGRRKEGGREGERERGRDASTCRYGG